MQKLNTLKQSLALFPQRQTLNLAEIVEWGKQHYRYRGFDKDELIPVRSGLIYFVEKGTVRLVGKSHQLTSGRTNHMLETHVLDDTFLQLVSASQPFEVTSHLCCQLQCIAQMDNTNIIWMYWEELERWGDFRQNVLNSFRYQQQRLVLRLHALGQRHTCDRLMLFLQLLIEDHGEPHFNGNFLPFALTHLQIANAIGATRVTVTRAISKLRQHGQVLVSQAGFLGLPQISYTRLQG